MRALFIDLQLPVSKNISKMKLALKIIPFDDIEKSFATANCTGKKQTDYNTHCHGNDEISAVLPEFEHSKPDMAQPWILLEPWLDLIISSQGLTDREVHRVKLPPMFLNRVVPACNVALITGHLADSDLEDLEDSFPSITTRGIPLEKLLRENRFFVRLDTCSLKDALIGQGAIKNTQDLWTRLATSLRGTAGIQALRQDDKDIPIYLYLFPWNASMDNKFEYRVFCAPCGGEISAISQYQWHSLWHHGTEEALEQERVTRRVLEGAEAIHAQIMAHSNMTESMRKRGFSFDVLEKDGEGGDVQLIELNHFGAMSGCGSCLFQWIRDARVLYGLENNGVEFRVAV